MKAITIFLLITIIFFSVIYITGYGYLVNAVRKIYFKGHTTAYLKDYTVFDNSTVETGTHEPWKIHKNYNQATLNAKLSKHIESTKTAAFLVIKDDAILYEKYYNGWTNTSKSNSFSMVKSMVAGLLGKAIMEGKIKSIDQKVSDFFPEFANSKGNSLTIRDLASMSSGLNWDEKYYSPFSVTTRSYFTDDIEKVILNLKIVENPGTKFKYLSGNTQLLGMVLRKATGKSLSQYLSESFWKPMGFAEPALWQVDSKENKVEKAYCCLASNARDFARFGKLYKNGGVWNNKQILDPDFVKLSITPRFKDKDGLKYGYGFWLTDFNGKKTFRMEGHLGQYVVVIPEDNLIVVRLGHSRVKGDDIFKDDIYPYLEGAYSIVKDVAKY